MDRRNFLSATTAVGTTLVAGCGGSSGGGAAGDGSTTDGEATDGEPSGDGGATASTGAFRLLISDRPADIDDFDSLDVTFDSARVFKAKSGGEDDPKAEDSVELDSEANESEIEANESELDSEANESEIEANESELDSEENESEAIAAESADADENDDSEGGFETFDLDSPTVDLTEVVGEKAIGVLDGELETGRYAKIELSVEAVEGVVDGETVPVKVPSNKLQITKPFEITGEGTVEFVFDINVVKKGPNGYNLLPVISESGVAGKDVDVEEIDAASQDTQASNETVVDADSSTNESEPEEEGGNPINESEPGAQGGNSDD